MTSVLRHKYRLRVSRETVRLLLRQIDHAGVALRRQHRLVRRTYWAPGPNYLWHLDGYDKLGSYGFHISGFVLQCHYFVSLYFANFTNLCTNCLPAMEIALRDM